MFYNLMLKMYLTKKCKYKKKLVAVNNLTYDSLK